MPGTSSPALVHRGLLAHRAPNPLPSLRPEAALRRYSVIIASVAKERRYKLENGYQGKDFSVGSITLQPQYEGANHREWRPIIRGRYPPTQSEQIKKQ